MQAGAERRVAECVCGEAGTAEGADSRRKTKQGSAAQALLGAGLPPGQEVGC